MLEQLTNERLVEILSMKVSDEEKLALLEAESTDRTKDNYTAYLIPIDKVEGASTLANDDYCMIVTTVEADTSPSVVQPQTVQQSIISKRHTLWQKAKSILYLKR